MKLSCFGIVCGFSLVRRKIDIKNSSLENIAGDYCDILQPFIFILWCTVEVLPHYRYCVGGCDNDSSYLEKVRKKGLVTGDLTWHYFSKDSKESDLWVKNILKRLEDREGCEPLFNSFLLRMLSLIICCTYVSYLMSTPGHSCSLL